MVTVPQNTKFLDRPILPTPFKVSIYHFLFIVIVIVALISRFYALGSRVMSHDESLHVYYSWLYSIGQGYQHNPATHGPLQFHLIALTDFLFGATDFTARLPHAIASILGILFIAAWKRYVGRVGVLVTAALLVVSPFMLYYGRYARNEAFIVLIGLLTFFGILRYLETGKNRYLLFFTIGFSLHYATKETAFIYAAQALIFLFIMVLFSIMRSEWKKEKLAVFFISGVFLVVTFIIIMGVVFRSTPWQEIPAVLLTSPVFLILLILTIFVSLVTILLLLVGFGWDTICQVRGFSLFILLVTFTLPQLAAFPVKALGWDPLAYQFSWPGWNLPALWSQGPFKTAVVFGVLCIISGFIGLAWGPKRWLLYASVFWSIYLVLYSSFFSNMPGVATGLVGSLGYWIEQQGVQRGGQPWYYYLLIQIPIYEYLPFLGASLAVFFHLGKTKNITQPVEPAAPKEFRNKTAGTPFFVVFLSWWALSSLVAFSFAGEKMPWLTVHIILPMILLAGWGIGRLIEGIRWREIRINILFFSLIAVIVLLSLLGLLIDIYFYQAPFLIDPDINANFNGRILFLFFVFISSLYLLWRFRKRYSIRDALLLTTLLFLGFLFILTARTAFRAAFVNPNEATEYLVYAHGADGVHDVVNQLDLISTHITGGNNLSFAYDNSSPDAGVAWPLTWYFRDYSKKASFSNVEQNLIDFPVILVDENEINDILAISNNKYYSFEYIRMVWPNQDYFGLTWERFQNAFRDEYYRAALWEIWLSRDYSLYGGIENRLGLTPSDWSPGDHMYLLIDKELSSQIWEYGQFITSQSSIEKNSIP